MEDAMRKTVESYVIEEKRLELQGVLGKGKSYYVDKWGQQLLPALMEATK